MPTEQPTQSVTRSTTVASTPDEVWALVGDFAGIHHWHPGTTEAELRPADGARTPGTERVFGAGSDAELVERLVERDETHRQLGYSMPAPPFPITDHLAVITVAPDPAGALVTWTATFRSTDEVAADLEGVLGDGVFAPGLAALAAR